MSLTFTQRVLHAVIPTPVSRFLVRNFHHDLPLSRRLIAVVPAGVLLGGSIELFMNATGFYPVLVRKAGERRAEEAFNDAREKARREEFKRNQQARMQQQQQQQQQHQQQ